MKITVLMENTAKDEALKKSHGLSLYIEADQRQILFDTGPNNNFLENAKALGIDISAVNLAFLSHGHYDHGGGISDFFKANEKSMIYINRNAFSEYYRKDKNGRYEYIGIDRALKNNSRVIYTDSILKLGTDLTLYSQFEHRASISPINSALFEKNAEGSMIADSFRHEQCIFIRGKEKNVLISGCAHNGVENILTQVEERAKEHVDVMIGGFHLHTSQTKEIDTAYVCGLAEKLKAYSTKFYTCHCTGCKEYAILKKIMGDQIDYICTGETLIL